MHFFNPVPMMALVEVIRGLQTSDATVAATEALAKRLGKAPIVVRNSPGFVVEPAPVPDDERGGVRAAARASRRRRRSTRR